MKFSTVACVLGLGAVASSEVFLEETFNDGDAWTKRWTVSNYRDDLGKVELSAGKWFADEKELVGLQTTEDYRFYALATSLKKPFNNTDKDFVAQFSVKHEQKIDCGGGYLKFYPSKFDAKTFNGDSEYNIMFGPDLCGSKNLVHVIFNYKGTNHNYKKTITAPTDTLTHVYTLIVKPDQTYSVLVDGEEKGAGSLIEDWDVLPPLKIKDPNASKPADWVEEPR
ncbi:Calreticulin/calnexin, partial [Jimgerdemannia flammicorona]